ncbi:MAG: flagellar biosynthesis anti-sigma factor FlgM [Desulfuromonadaceae bacterium]|nr:flagellar biosynthesis anti-sigma factor FlgM [Desulfuromonadaceae bacterium]
MKVDERVSGYLDLLQKEAAKTSVSAGSEAPVSADAVPTPVAVDISSAASQLADDEARRERLNAIRQQLSEGSYNISGKDVANKMLNVLKG